MRRAALATLLILAAFAFTSTAAAQTPLHRGSKGGRVCAAQWLLSGHRPSAYPWLRVYKVHKPTLHGNGCQYGPKTIAAVREAKRHLGFKLYWNGTAGRDFLEILQGKRTRPLGYVARAAKIRAAELETQRKREAALDTFAARIIAAERSQIGVHEVPWGSNWGSRVPAYLAAAGLHSPAPWCAALQQWGFLTGGIGRFANGSAGVFYIVGYARERGWIRAYPKPGFLIAFLDRLGHIGLVERLSPSGIYTIEGNASNAVEERFHPYSSSRPHAFIEVPGVLRAVHT